MTYPGPMLPPDPRFSGGSGKTRKDLADDLVWAKVAKYTAWVFMACMIWAFVEYTTIKPLVVLIIVGVLSLAAEEWARRLVARIELMDANDRENDPGRIPPDP